MQGAPQHRLFHREVAQWHVAAGMKDIVRRDVPAYTDPLRPIIGEELSKKGTIP